jgi:hypothetical protein
MPTDVTRLSGAAFAADVEVERLRSWIKQYGVLGPSPDGRGWRAFGRPDVAELAITRELVAWGAAPRLAWDVAHQVVAQVTGIYRKAPAEARADRLDRILAGGGAAFARAGLARVGVVRTRDPKVLGLLKRLHDDADPYEVAARKMGASAVLVLDVEHIVNEALARMDGSGDD